MKCPLCEYNESNNHREYQRCGFCHAYFRNVITHRDISLKENYTRLYKSEERQYQKLKNLIINNNIKFKTFIDIGSGSGFIARRISDEFAADVTAIEKEEYGIKHWIDVIQTDLLEWQTDQKFDFLFANHVLEHIRDVNAAVKKIKELMHDQSILYLSVPNASSKRSLSIPDHYYAFTLVSLLLLFERYNIVPIKNDFEMHVKTIKRLGMYSTLLRRQMECIGTS